MINSNSTTVRKNYFAFTFGAVATENFTFTAPTKPGSFLLKMKQDATGGRTIPTWPASVKWPSGTAVTLSTAANSIDIITFFIVYIVR